MRVLRVLTRPNLGGPTRQAIALWHAHAEVAVRTLLATGAVDDTEPMLSPADGGVPVLSLDAAIAAGEAACGWVQIPGLVRATAPLGDRRARRALRALMRSLRPDVVHTHTSKAGFVGRRAAFAENVPVVAHTFHGHVLQDYFAPPIAWALRALERRLAARTDLLFAVSDSCAAELASAGIAPRERIAVVPPAVPYVPVLPRAVARQRLGIGPDEVRVVCIGRLVPIKRVEHFVEAVAQLPHRVVGDVIGDGPQRAQLAALIARIAPGRVQLRGAVPHIAGLLAAYDALLLPSVREGSPLVAVEAFAAGVPVIGYDVPGVRDVLANGTGSLVQVAAGPAGLAAAVQQVVASPMATAAGVAAGRRARDTYGPAGVAARLLAAYRPARQAARRYHAVPPA